MPQDMKTLLKIIEEGLAIRVYLEGDWSRHWHHLLELPKVKVICDIDTQADIFKAIDELGRHLCITGGIPNSLLIVGTPDQIRERVKTLCEASGKDRRLLVNGGCNIPHDTNPANFRAMIDAILEFATYDSSLHPMPKPAPERTGPGFQQKMMTSWETRRTCWGNILGDEGLIREPWEQLERTAHAWVWQWTL